MPLGTLLRVSPALVHLRVSALTGNIKESFSVDLPVATGEVFAAEVTSREWRVCVPKAQNASSHRVPKGMRPFQRVSVNPAN